MALTDFIKRPAIKDAFKTYAVRPETPQELRKASVLAPCKDTKMASFVGTAFDYLARFRTARDLVRDYPDSEFVVYDAGWVAESAVAMMRSDPRYARWYPRWSHWVTKGRELLDEFVRGRETSIERVAKCCQCMAAADILYRTGQMNFEFMPRDDVQNELLALDAAFRPSEMFRPERAVLLNPTYAASSDVGGADADIVVDGTTIDIKTTIDPTLKIDHLRQLAGYAALQALGGACTSDGPYTGMPQAVGLYFSRQGVLVRWILEEIFPGDGFERYVDAFRAEMFAYAA